MRFQALGCEFRGVYAVPAVPTGAWVCLSSRKYEHKPTRQGTHWGCPPPLKPQGPWDFCAVHVYTCRLPAYFAVRLPGKVWGFRMPVRSDRRRTFIKEPLRPCPATEPKRHATALTARADPSKPQVQKQPRHRKLRHTFIAAATRVEACV